MPKALAPADAGALLKEHAGRIIAANEKLRGDFCDYIDTVGGSLKAAQASLASDRAGFYKWAREQVGFSKSRVYQILAEHDVVSRLSTLVDDRIALPSNEAQCRALAALPKKQLGKVWTQAVEAASESGREPTAALIRRLAPGGHSSAGCAAAPDPDAWLDKACELFNRFVESSSADRIAEACARMRSVLKMAEPLSPYAVIDAEPMEVAS